MDDGDIDQFIQSQKAKLANERQHLNNETDTQSANVYHEDRPPRQKWAQFDSDNAPAPAVQYQKRMTTPVDRGLPLTNKGYEDRQRALAIERNKEYNAMLEKKTQKQKPEQQTGQYAAHRKEGGLDIGHYQDGRKVLDIERHQEYLKYMEEQKSKNANPSKTVQGYSDERNRQENVHAGDGRYNYQEVKKRLAEERKREYNEMLQSKLDAKNRPRESEIDNPSIIPFNRVEQDKMKARILEEERQREYNEVKAKLEGKQRQRAHTPPETYGFRLDTSERKRQKEREQQEYKAMLDKQREYEKQMKLLEQGVPYERISKMVEKKNFRNDFENPSSNQAYRQSDEQMPDREAYNPQPDFASENQRPPYNQEPKVHFDQEAYSNYSPHTKAPYQQFPDERESPAKFDNYNDSRQQQGTTDDYKRLWQQQNDQRPGNQRKKWNPPLKLSPRGPILDTDEIAARVQRDQFLSDYQDKWRQEHKRDQAPRFQPSNMTRGEKLNTDSIVDKVLGKEEDTFTPRNRPPVRPGLSTNLNTNDDAEIYKKTWQENNKMTPLGSDNASVSHRTSADYRKRLIEVRNKEYNDFLRKKNEENKFISRHWHSPVTAAEETPFALGQYEEKQKEYVEQCKKELQDHLYKNNQSPRYYMPQRQENNRTWKRTFQEEAFPLGKYEGTRKKLNEERRREYNEYLKQKQGQSNYSPRSEKHRDVAVLIKDEGRMERRKEMEMMRNKEYNELINKKRSGTTNLQQQTDDFKANGLPVNQSDNAKWQKMKERNDEYNQFLANKNERDRNRFASKKGAAPQADDTDYGKSIPGLGTNSAQKHRMREERNREYNDMLHHQRERGRVPPPKQGWSTPDYQDLLEKNRAKEQNYRRANDIAYETDPKTRYTEWLNRELDRDLAAKRKAYWRDRHSYYGYPGYGILDDPSWLSPRNAYAERHYNNMEEVKEKPAHPKSNKNYHDAVTDDRVAPNVGTNRRRLDKGGEYYYASLPLDLPHFGRPAGRDQGSAQRRQKNEYRIDLEKQMAQTAQARQLERQEGILVNNNGLLESSRVPKQRSRNAMDYNAILAGAGIEDDSKPNTLFGRRQDTADRKKFRGLNTGLGGGSDKVDLGILDVGLFQNTNPRATSLAAPAGLEYQPSTYITANAVPTLNNSVDEAYNFFATKNPLDPDMKTDVGEAFAPGTEVVRKGPADVPALNLTGVTGDGSRVRFNDQRAQPTAAQGMNFGSDDDRKKQQRQTTTDYREELERQIAEKKLKDRLAKEERERYELKMEQEARNYDPFGKGGGGAPMRDQQGNVISDLRQMRNDNNVTLTNRSHRRDLSPRVDFAFDSGAVAAGNTSRGANSYRDDLIGPPPTQTTADGDPSFARGGHGIFGMPKTDVEKMQADKYKLDLRKQIEEKKADEFRKKQLEKLEEEREQRLLEEQRVRMQAEYDEEQRRIMEKKEEARLKNEEMMRAAEEKKRELERQRREEDERRQQELREEKDRELRERQRAEEERRGKSPPVPVLQGKDKTEEPKEEKGIDSPPVPAARTRTVEPDVTLQDNATRAQSADVLNQLTRLRAELRKESDRVQTMLHDQEDDVEIYDPRQIHRPPPAPVVAGSKPEIDVFETALNRNAVAVRRTPADRASSTVVDDFNALKHKNDSDSRKHFRNQYPYEPVTSDALEAQQAALLRQQEARLRNLKERRDLEDLSALRIGRDLHSSSSQLHSNSAFVDVNGVSQFPDDFDDMPKRNDSARYRRRSRIPSSPRIERILTPEINSRSTFGSQTSLNVDKLAKKNENRLRKLRDMQVDDVSLYDPEDVLNRFMSKQDHNRPPSRNTLLDDTWMRAGSKQSKY